LCRLQRFWATDTRRGAPGRPHDGPPPQVLTGGAHDGYDRN